MWLYFGTRLIKGIGQTKTDPLIFLLRRWKASHWGVRIRNRALHEGEI